MYLPMRRSPPGAAGAAGGSVKTGIIGMVAASWLGKVLGGGGGSSGGP
jgi:hypothetical protein